MLKTSIKIHLMPGCPDTSEFLRSRIAIIARIPGYIYPDISPDTIHQPALRFTAKTVKHIHAGGKKWFEMFGPMVFRFILAKP